MRPSARSTLGRCVISARNVLNRLLLLIARSVVWWKVSNKLSSTKMATCTKDPSFATRTGSRRITLAVSNSWITCTNSRSNDANKFVNGRLTSRLGDERRIWPSREMLIFLGGSRFQWSALARTGHSLVLLVFLRTGPNYETSSGLIWPAYW